MLKENGNQIGARNVLKPIHSARKTRTYNPSVSRVMGGLRPQNLNIFRKLELTESNVSSHIQIEIGR
jgi:hypothetical protein